MNLAIIVSNYAGAFLLDVLDVNPQGAIGESAQFENLWIAALVSACGPCVPLLLVRVLIPDASQVDKLLVDGDPCSATVGSLFERWKAHGWQCFTASDYGEVPQNGGRSDSKSS